MDLHAWAYHFIARSFFLSTKWVDYVEEPMKYQALRPQFFSMGGWGVVGWGWWVGGNGVGWVVVGWGVVEGWWVVGGGWWVV